MCLCDESCEGYDLADGENGTCVLGRIDVDSLLLQDVVTEGGKRLGQEPFISQGKKFSAHNLREAIGEKIFSCSCFVVYVHSS